LDGIAKQGWLYWAITLKNTDALIGSICLWNLSPENKTAELGYELHPDFHGKGIMQEAVKVILQFAFEKMEVEAVTAFPTTANLPSQKLLERNGFKIETDPSGPEDLGDYVFYIYKRINH
jgi:[ribosomal protein S5]-alanine N-acetyltransferase